MTILPAKVTSGSYLSILFTTLLILRLKLLFFLPECPMQDWYELSYFHFQPWCGLSCFLLHTNCWTSSSSYRNVLFLSLYILSYFQMLKCTCKILRTWWTRKSSVIDKLILWAWKLFQPLLGWKLFNSTKVIILIIQKELILLTSATSDSRNFSVVASRKYLAVSQL